MTDGSMEPTSGERQELGLVEQIKIEHEACRDGIASSLEHARRCGDLLIRAKGGMAQKDICL